MKKFDLSKVVKNTKASVSKHSPEILTGIGIAGMIGTTVIAVRATPKALKLLEAERELKAENGEEISKTDIIKTTWKCYIPAAVTGTVSVVCLIGASSVNHKRNAALVTAYTISETAFSEYRDKVIESIGEKKEREIRDEVAKDKIAKKYNIEYVIDIEDISVRTSTRLKKLKMSLTTD